MRSEFKISEKEAGFGMGSGSQRQGDRVWGGSPEPTESEGCG